MGVVGDVGVEAVASYGDRRAAGGDVGAVDGLPEEITQEFLRLPGGVDLPAVGPHVPQLGLEEGVLFGGDVFPVATQEFADGADGIALAARRPCWSVSSPPVETAPSR